MNRMLLMLCCAFVATAPSPSMADVVRLAPMGRILVPEAEVRIVPTVFYPGWISRTPYGGYRPEADGSRRWRIAEKWNYGDPNNGTNFIGSTSAKVAPDGSLDVSVSIETVVTNVRQIGSVVCARIPVSRYAGGKAVLDGRMEKPFPVEYRKGRIGVFREKVREVALIDKDGVQTLAFRFLKPMKCYLQDNREWKSSDIDVFTLRVSFEGKGSVPDLVRGDAFSMDFNLKTPGPVEYCAGEYVIEEGSEWTRIKAMNDPAPGSALDFSQVVPHDAPAGKHGWLVVRNGHFEFESLPGVKQRFYGVNFVGESNYPPAKDADRYVANLARIGYNAVRFHHHDGGLADSRGELKPERMARFDAMVAACIKHGVYMTTDLYVSRRVAYRDMGIDKPGFASMREFKTLVETHEGAFSNFLNYAKNFLSHVNPHTGRRYADEPAMPLYSLVNEGNSRKELTLANERDFARRMTRWVRDEMKSRILLTNMNNYAYPEEFDEVRANEYDYADEHFYVDHPHFLEQKWSLPSELQNTNPLKRDRHGLFWALGNRRRMGKAMPFVITEYNFSGPGAYRSLGGIETGALAAREDIDGLWRFAWSHGIKGVYGPKPMTYFDMSGDPLSLAGERASLCLFLRGDLDVGDADALKIDPATGSLRIETGRTCGVFAESGKIRAGCIEANVMGAAATVWASSLDGNPLSASGRILLCHQTDVQNSGAAFADDSRTVLLRWGQMPHLMRKGRADISLSLAGGEWTVYALDCAGNRRGVVPSHLQDGRLCFTADVARDPADATMNYELVRR